MSSISISAVLVLDSQSGSRIHAKYFSPELIGAPDKQLAFEEAVLQVCRVQRGDVLMLEGSLAVYYMGTDVFFYVVGGVQENEIILQIVLDAFTQTLKSVLRGHLDKHTILDNLELLLLTVDEIVDRGTVLETDSAVLSKRVMLRNPDGSNATMGSGGMGGGGAGGSAGLLAGLPTNPPRSPSPAPLTLPRRALRGFHDRKTQR
ncbi:hypothetical protein BASA82_000270 [Batrachochytrium salamandrivorans]|nr:hypothetical protein BASA82_000270 [Batrachochytrium salamandrivorans]